MDHLLNLTGQSELRISIMLDGGSQNDVYATDNNLTFGTNGGITSSTQLVCDHKSNRTNLKLTEQ